MMCRRVWMAVLFAVLLSAAACGPRTPEQQLMAARDALGKGDGRTAEIHLKNLLQQQPSNAEARVMLGQLLLARGEAAGAEHHLQAALDLGEDPAPLKLLLLRALLNQSKFAQVLAQSDADLAATRGMERTVILAVRGAAHRGLGQLKEAEAAYREALTIDPNSLVNRNELAAVYFQAGQLAESRALVTALLMEQSDYVPALLLSGSIEAAAARYDAASSIFERVLEIEKDRRGSHQWTLALSQLIDAQLAQRHIDAAAKNAATLLRAMPSSPNAEYLQARVDTERGDLTSAERRLEQVIAADPAYWGAYLLLGIINTNQKQFGQAEMYLRRAAAGNPRDPRARLLLADVYIRQNNVGEARGVLDQSPLANDSLFLALAGRASLEAGQPELAADYFTRSEQNKPVTLRELVDVSSVYIAAGELERAIRILQSASLDEPDGERLATYLLALVQLRRGNLTAADATAQRFTDPTPEMLNLRGTIAMYTGDLNRARELFSKALDARSTYMPAMLNMARVAVAQGQKDAAAEQLRRVLEVDPNQLNAIFGMVQLAADRRDFDAAETWLARAPESALRSQLAGDLHFARRKFDDAFADYSRAFGIRPTADLALKLYATSRQAGRPEPEAPLLAWAANHPADTRVQFALGSFASERGDQDEAIRRYEGVLAADAAHAGALNNLAWLYGERDDPRALDLAARANTVRPNDPSVLDTLGWLYERRGDFATALPLLRRAASLSPSQPDIGYHLAAALAASGESRQALEMLDRLVAGNDAFTSRGAAVALRARLRNGDHR